MEQGGGFCASPLFDVQTSWNTTDPDFTQCFHKTVLSWIPCAFLVLIAPFRIYHLTKSQATSIPFTILNILKTVLAVCIALVMIADIIKSIQEFAAEEVVPTVNFVSPLVICLTMVLAVILIQQERKHGVQSSGYMVIFWMLLLTAAILLFQSKVRIAIREGDIPDLFRFITFFISFPLILGQFILTFFVDRRKNIYTSVKNDDKPCPEPNSSFVSRITYWWFTGMVRQGYKRALERKDLFGINIEDSCSTVIPHFEKYWEKEVEKEKRRKSSKDHETPETGGIELKSREENGDVYTEVDVKDGKPAYKASLLIGLIRTFWPIFCLSGFFKFLFDILQFISPLILKLLIQFTKDKAEYVWRGYLYAVVMLVVNIMMSLILHRYFYLSQILGLRLRTAVIGIVYKKMLTLSNAARRTSTVGEIVNLMSVDAQRFMDLMTYFHTIWSGPFQIAVSLYFLWQTLGPSVLAGTGIMVVMIPINAIIAKKARDYQMKQMRLKDLRIKLMNEVLNGIKVLKLYAWEKSFEQQVLEIRNKELFVLKKMAYLNAAVSFTWTTAPFLVSLVTFAVYVLVDSNNVLDAEKAFVSLSLFNILRFPLSMLPQVISNIVQASVSLKRLQNFLNNEELDPQAVSRDPNAKHAITIEKGTFTWERDNVATLRQINLEIPQGSLVAVVGTVGSGKSSILSAILGEMDKIGGNVNVKGSVAYVAQQAWIQNATLQDNILFGKGHYDTQYDKVVDACALKPDIEILPAGDKTEIGEKGINLSGGQKQRVSLARAVYHDADVYLMDDPLSAVDSHVGKHIFENVIGPTGILNEKTRVLVTHGISFLPKVDLIVVLVDGQISEVGTFQELIGHAGAFAEFLKNYLTEELENPDEQDLEEMEDLKMADEIVSQLGSIGVIEDEYTAKFHRQVSKFSTRMRTMSDASKDSSLHSTGTPAGTQLSPWKGSQPKFPDGVSVTPQMKQKFEHHTKEEKETEALKKQVQEKSKEEKLIKEEGVEIGNVKFSVFLAYLKSVGVVLSSLIILFYILYNVASVYSNIWLSQWSDDEIKNINGTVDTKQRDLRLGVYGALGLVQGLFAALAGLGTYVGNVLAGRILHAHMINNVMAAPMRFFDTTPTGRIINRFNKDIDTIDALLPLNFQWWLRCLFMNVAIPIVIGYSTPLCLLVMIPMAAFYYFVQAHVYTEGLGIPPMESFRGLSGLMVGLSNLNMESRFEFVKDYNSVLAMVSDFTMAMAGLTASYRLYLGLIHNMLRCPMMFYETHTMGSIMNRYTEDIAEIDFVVHFTVRSMLNAVLQTVGCFAVMISSTPAVACVFPILGPPYFFCQRFYVATSRQLKRLESVSRSPIYSHFGETVTGVATIRAYSQEDRFITVSEDKVDENLVCFFPSMVANRWLAVRLEFVANSIVFFATLFAVIGRDSLSPGIVGLSITYALNVTQTLNWLVRMTCELETNIVAVERVKEYSETPREAAWEIEDNRPDPKWPDSGVVEFKNYGTRYREGLDLVLKGISCKIEPGEKIGIVGRTGAGKSSLTMALFRIIEKAMGSIIIDGLDISTLGLHDLRSKLTIIPQEPVLFSGTLRMNLDPFNANTDEQLWQALDHAHLKDFVSGLPTQLQHECAEGGENLSVGQRQLVCLARALLRKTKILVLDEATAAVDLETDDLIQNTIRTEFADCTILTIAHRLNTIMDYNKILVLDAGEISEFDSPHTLLKDQNSIFYGMAKDAGLVY